MLRPRGGDFLYTAAELAVIEADLHASKAAGADGVVVGLLLDDGRVDEERLRRIVRLAAPLPVTFHRAIDVTPDPVEALHACARCGVHRVLTSGGQPTAVQVRVRVRIRVRVRVRIRVRVSVWIRVRGTLTLTLSLSRPRCRVPRRCAGWSTPSPLRTTRW